MIKRAGGEQTPYVLVGNKIDVGKNHRKVKPKSVVFHRKNHNMPYSELSVLSNYNIEKPFLAFCQMLANDPNLRITEAPAYAPPELTVDPHLLAEYENEMRDAVAYARNCHAGLPDEDEDF